MVGARKASPRNYDEVKTTKTGKRAKLIQRSGFEPCTRPTKPTTASWRCSNSDSREVRVEIETVAGSGSPPRQVKVPMRHPRRLGDLLLSTVSDPRSFESGTTIPSRRISQCSEKFLSRPSKSFDIAPPLPNRRQLPHPAAATSVWQRWCGTNFMHLPIM